MELLLAASLNCVNTSNKPWYVARWDTIEPTEPEETVYNDSEIEYNEPSNNGLIDIEYGFEYGY